MFKPIMGYEKYLINENGVIISYRTKKPMKTYISKKGYETIDFKINGKRYRGLSVHRLVAKTFIDNPNNLQQVNHKDENKLNNCVYNLEWCDNKYNVNYGTRNKRISETRYKNYCKPILKISKEGEVLKEYRYVDKTLEDGYNASNIRAVLKGRRKYAHGFFWKYKE